MGTGTKLVSPLFANWGLRETDDSCKSADFASPWAPNKNGWAVSRLSGPSGSFPLKVSPFTDKEERIGSWIRRKPQRVVRESDQRSEYPGSSPCGVALCFSPDPSVSSSSSFFDGKK